MLVDAVTQELHSLSCTHTLCRVDLQAIFLKDGLSKMVMVLLQGVAGDDVVVEVGEHEGQVLE